MRPAYDHFQRCRDADSSGRRLLRCCLCLQISLRPVLQYMGESTAGYVLRARSHYLQHFHCGNYQVVADLPSPRQKADGYNVSATDDQYCHHLDGYFASDTPTTRVLHYANSAEMLFLHGQIKIGDCSLVTTSFDCTVACTSTVF